MANNLYVAYDLDNAPPERYEVVRNAIELCATHGYAWHQLSLAYVKTDISPKGVHDRVRLVMRPTDKLAVIHALDAFVSPLDPNVRARIQREFQSA